MIATNPGLSGINPGKTGLEPPSSNRGVDQRKPACKTLKTLNFGI